MGKFLSIILKHFRLLPAAITLISCDQIAFAQTLRKPLPPCHMLPEITNPKTECFDDKDRDGKFSYDRGDRAWDLNGWRRFQGLHYDGNL